MAADSEGDRSVTDGGFDFPAATEESEPVSAGEESASTGEEESTPTGEESASTDEEESAPTGEEVSPTGEEEPPPTDERGPTATGEEVTPTGEAESRLAGNGTVSLATGDGTPTVDGAGADGFEGVRTRPDALEIDEWLDHPEYVEFLESFGELSAPDDELDLTDLLEDESVDTSAGDRPAPDDGSGAGEFELATLASRFRALAAYTDGLEAFVDGNVAAEELLEEVRTEQTRLREELAAVSTAQAAQADRLAALESEIETMASRWERLDELLR